MGGCSGWEGDEGGVFGDCWHRCPVRVGDALRGDTSLSCLCPLVALSPLRSHGHVPSATAPLPVPRPRSWGHGAEVAGLSLSPCRWHSHQWHFTPSRETPGENGLGQPGGVPSGPLLSHRFQARREECSLASRCLGLEVSFLTLWGWTPKPFWRLETPRAKTAG